MAMPTARVARMLAPLAFSPGLSLPGALPPNPLLSHTHSLLCIYLYAIVSLFLYIVSSFFSYMVSSLLSYTVLLLLPNTILSLLLSLHSFITLLL